MLFSRGAALALSLSVMIPVGGCIGCGSDSSTAMSGSGANGATGTGGAGGGGAGAGGAAVMPIDASASCGHAHNDYLHEVPLQDAVDAGFCSFEADIYLQDDQLLVAHTMAEIRSGKTIQSLYLDPLRALAESQPSSLQGPGGGPVVLLVDVKSSAEATYAALAPVLAEYADILTSFEDGVPTARVATVILSGERAEATVAAEMLRYAAIDGRIGDPNEVVAASTPASLVPLVSQRWTKLFAYDGVGEMSAEERTLLDDYVAQAHDDGRLLRFWSTPDNEAIWRVLGEAKVDLINTDDLDGLSTFLKDNPGDS